MTKEQYLQAITNYSGYSASTAKVLAELYRTSVNLQATLTVNELTQRLDLQYGILTHCIRALVKNGFLTPATQAIRNRLYKISQEKLDELMTIYKAKTS